MRSETQANQNSEKHQVGSNYKHLRYEKYTMCDDKYSLKYNTLQ